MVLTISLGNPLKFLYRVNAVSMLLAIIAAAAAYAEPNMASERLSPMVLPAAAAIADEDSVVLAGRNARTVIIIGKLPEYVFPYWGGHRILQRYLKIITGVETPIIAADKLKSINLDNAYDFRIWVGRQPQVDYFIGAQLDKIDDDGFIIRCVGKDLYISGKYDWGTHFAVYDLLERFAGCRWYLWEPRFWEPAKDGYFGIGDIIPKAPKVKVPRDVNIIEQPSYKMRWMHDVPQHSFHMRYRDKFHHELVNYLNPEEYANTHPEYYPFINGVRQIPPQSRRYDFQPCVSNPEVEEIIVTKIKKYLLENPGQNSVSIGMNDSDNFCRCDKCLAIAPAGITNADERIAYAFFDFYNRIAADVVKEFPNVRIGCLAYAGLVNLPAGSIKMHKNIVPYLTVDSAQLFDVEQQKEFSEKLKKWGQFSEHTGVYEYCFGQGFLIPRLYNRYITKNIKERYGIGADGFYAEDYPNWGLDGHKYWLISKLLWNNQADANALLDDYYRNMFGPCAGIMKRYFDELESAWCSQSIKSDKSNYRWMYDARQFEIFPPDKCERAMVILIEAEELIGKYLAAEKQTEKAEYCREIAGRIDYFKSSFAFTTFMSKRYASAKELESLCERRPFDFGKTAAAFDKWLAMGNMKENYSHAMVLPKAFYPEDYETFCERWDSSSVGAVRAMRTLVDETVLAAIAGNDTNSNAVRSRIDIVFNEKAGRGYNLAGKLVTDTAKESGFIFASAVKPKPVIDGDISAGEWGSPTYSGSFFKVYSISERVPDKTTIWATADGQKLYLAFKCDGDTSVIGADVVGRNTDVSVYPKMVNDDCISITIEPDKGGYEVVSVNANGAIRDKGRNGNLVSEYAVKKTGAGWQAELAIDTAATGLAKETIVANPTRLCISRYYRYKPSGESKDKTIQTGCSTITPVPKTGNIIGHGNHVNCMVFIDGPYFVYQNLLE